MTLPNFPTLDLFAAGINALNGVLHARNPSHDRGYTLWGAIWRFWRHRRRVRTMLNEIPGPPLNAYRRLC